MDHAAHRIDLALGADDPPLPLVRFAGERGAERHARPGLIRTAPIRQRQIEIGELVIRQREPDLGGVNGVDGRDRVADPDKLPDVDALLPDAPRVRRTNLRPFQVALRAFQVGLGARDRRARFFELRLSQRQLAWVAATELFPFTDRHFGLGFFLREAQPCLGELRARAHDRLLIVERVDLDEDVTQLEETALGERGGRPT